MSFFLVLERVPRWPYEIEKAQIASQERLAAAIELLAVNVDRRLASIEELLAKMVEALVNSPKNKRYTL